MVALDWPRPPLVLGLVLGSLADKNLGIAHQRYGYDFFTDPTVMVIFGLAIASLVYALIQNARIAKARAGAPPQGPEGSGDPSGQASQGAPHA